MSGPTCSTVTGSYTQTAGTFTPCRRDCDLDLSAEFAGGLVDARGTINAAITNNAKLQAALGGNGLNVNGDITLLTSSQLSFQLGGLTQGNQYGYLNVNGTVAIGGQLVVSFVSGFQNVVSSSDEFTAPERFQRGLGGAFSNVPPGGRLETSDGFGSFQVDYDATRVVLSNFIPSGGEFLNFAGLDSATGGRRQWTQPEPERGGLCLRCRRRGIPRRFL